MQNYFSDFITKLNRRNAGAGAHRPAVISCLGDSVTHGAFEVGEYADGSGLRIAFDSSAVYHARLARYLGELYPRAVPAIVNAGVSGDNAPGGLGRVERDLLFAAPDLCIVCYGLNDVGWGLEGIASYTAALEGIFEKLRGIPVIFLTPCMLNTKIAPELTTPGLKKIAENCAALQNSGVFDKYMDAARELAAQHGVALCDEYARYQNWREAGVDTDLFLSNHINHPTREIHDLWARDLVNTIIG